MTSHPMTSRPMTSHPMTSYVSLQYLLASTGLRFPPWEQLSNTHQTRMECGSTYNAICFDRNFLQSDWSICTTWPICSSLIGYWQKWLTLLLLCLCRITDHLPVPWVAICPKWEVSVNVDLGEGYVVTFVSHACGTITRITHNPPKRPYRLLRSKYENATPNLCWVFCALLGVLCN